MKSMTGQTVSHYRIVDKLGEGGMGVVYRAEDTRLKRDVAIKFLPPHIASSPDERNRLRKEAQAAAALNHPNIATVYAIEEADDEIFIVMEYIDGKELHDIVRAMNEANMPIADIIRYSTQIAEGLKAAHDKGVVHRDIKSSNIMVTGSGQVKIMDFGLAKVHGNPLVTKVGSTLGTVAYMSPEQARGEEVDHRTDIWSFGVVMYEMLTGRLPFGGDYEHAVIFSILNEEPQPLSNVRKDLPKELAHIVNRAMSKNRTDRYPGMSEVLQEMKPLQSPDGMSGRTLPLSRVLRKPVVAVPVVVVILILGGVLAWWIRYNAKAEKARQRILPQIETMVGDIPWTGEGPKSWIAFDLGEEAAAIIPDDPLLKLLRPKFSRYIRIFSEPRGAKVYARPYADSTHDWRYIGETPIDRVIFPVGVSRVKLEKEGYRTTRDLVWNGSFMSDTVRFGMAVSGTVPDEMEFVPQSSSSFDVSAAPAGLHMPGLEQVKPIALGDFLMDRYEVTNKAYKRFVDGGGYQNRIWWKYPFVKETHTLTWEDGMKLLIDKTGQPGPAAWEVGDYPNGQGDYPVTGISWYEAAAYAEYAGKTLPTIYHWDRVALTWASPGIVPLSNLGGKGPMPVGQSNSMNRFGVFDLAGNAREWCFNEISRGGRFILGGGWNDAAYSFNDSYAQSEFDRSETNGFRCIRKAKGEAEAVGTEKAIALPFRDFLREKPVTDATFKLMLNQYGYDKSPLNAVIEAEEKREEWIRQKTTFSAAYGKERMIAYLFLPRNAHPPFETVIYFPGSGAIHTRAVDSMLLGSRDFLVKSGRAVVIPIYKSTYERGDDLTSDYPDDTNFWKEHVIMWTKDVSRSIDYLETRKDIDTHRLAYFGASWGGAMGGIIPAVEKRINVVVLLVAGLQFQRSLPEAEPVNFLPRITVPVLMLNGKYDFFFPYDTSQLPFFQLLGTPKKDKKLFVYEGGHTVPRTEMVKETLTWLDHYLGAVSK